MSDDLILQRGERGLIVGNTGSGKTQMMIAQIRHHPYSPAVIFDTKADDGLEWLASGDDAVTVTSSKAMLAAMVKRKGPDIIRVLPPPSDMVDPEILDDYLMAIYERGKPALVAIDEVYQFHKGLQAGPGVVGLLTRGRSKGISLLACTQRPARLSRFFLTESQKFWVYRLQDKLDRKRMTEVMPYPVDLILDKHKFFYYKAGETGGTIYAPIKIQHDPGYSAADNPQSRWL